MLMKGTNYIFYLRDLINGAMAKCLDSGLTEPYEVTWRVVRDYVLVKWEHQLEDEPVHGYYVSVQEIQKGLRLGTPDFVHVGSRTYAVDIRGLKPRKIYEMKVVVY